MKWPWISTSDQAAVQEKICQPPAAAEAEEAEIKKAFRRFKMELCCSPMRNAFRPLRYKAEPLVKVYPGIGWTIIDATGGIVVSISYCPWCGVALPEFPMEL